MTVSSVRPFLFLAAVGLLAACGGPGPEPIAAPADEPPAVTAPAEPAGDDHGDSHGQEAGSAAAHVHGVADLAITREGNKILGELITPMANFGLAESDSAYTDVVTAELSGLIEIDGGDCTASVPHPMTDTSGGHTDGIVHFVWTCAKPDDVSKVRFAGFTAFPSFETVSTIYITEAEQKVGELTPASPELALN